MRAPKIVLLTGAGISAESGLATFRGAGGLWEGRRAEDLATPEAFERDPGMVHRFYNERRRKLMEVEPNEGHRALVRLEQEYAGEVVIVTQNVDDLHERAGSRCLLHMHGELLKSRCVSCGQVANCRMELGLDSECAGCGAVGTLRPHIVWFGEMPFFLDVIERHLHSAGLFIAVGTSGLVYPAAGFVDLASNLGVKTIEVNLVLSGPQGAFDDVREGPAGEVLPALVQVILAGEA